MSSASEGSRLGKLLALLESKSALLQICSRHLLLHLVAQDVFSRAAAGGSLDIRRAAAEQVATIARTHPAQLPSLLRHVSDANPVVSGVV